MKLNKQTILSYENFNKLTEDIMTLAKEIMPEKIIYINFLNEDVQVTMKVSNHDTKVEIKEGDTIDVSNAICNQIDYESGKPLIIEDTSKVDFNDNVKKTISNGNLGSYLGIPILFKNGSKFGALCAADHEKSVFDEKDVALLEKIAKLFSYYLELENIAYKDALTNLANSQFLRIQEEEMLKTGGLAIMIDLDSFKQINDNLGHHVGDLVLNEVGSKLLYFSLIFKDSYAIRLGGDEFFIYIKDNLSEEEIKHHLKELVTSLSVWETNIKDLPLSSSVGAYKFNSDEFSEFTHLLKKVDALLYEAKREGKNRYKLSN